MKERTGSKLTELSDAELLDRAKAQDQMAFVILYQRYRNALNAHVSRYMYRVALWDELGHELKVLGESLVLCIG